MQTSGAAGRKKNGIYLALFVLSLLSVARVLPWELMLAVVLIVLIFTDRAVFLQVDYCLLFTFISFFIFIGNMGNIEAVRSVLQSLVAGRELAVGIGASQIISNVPATLLLADFTHNLKNLTIGVNLGGLGTLIASMASLISYKIYAHNYNKTKGAVSPVVYDRKRTVSGSTRAGLCFYLIGSGSSTDGRIRQKSGWRIRQKSGWRIRQKPGWEEWI